MTTPIWNPFAASFWAQNGHDVWLNVVASIPFLLIDVAILTLLLPFAIEWLDRVRSRPLRLDALTEAALVIVHSLEALQERIHKDREALAASSDRRPKLSNVRRSIRTNLLALEQQLPIIMSMLDPESNRAVFNAYQCVRQVYEDHTSVNFGYTHNPPPSISAMSNSMVTVESLFIKLGGVHTHGAIRSQFDLRSNVALKDIQSATARWLAVAWEHREAHQIIMDLSEIDVSAEFDEVRGLMRTAQINGLSELEVREHVTRLLSTKVAREDQ